MTWVIATTSQIGYAIGISDIQVTYLEGEQERHKDCLQKIYRVAPSLGMGFAGSVKLGLDMRDDLTYFLGTRSEGEWAPEEAVQGWQPRAQHGFAQEAPEIRALGLEL